MQIRIVPAEKGIGMSDSEVKDFLSRSNLIVQLGTVDDEGEPNIHPAQYYYDRDDERLYIATSKNSRKAQNLKRKGKIYFNVDDDRTPYKGVRGKGHARILEDRNKSASIVEKIAMKYLGSASNPVAVRMLEATRRGAEIVVEVTPSYFSTWDYAKARS